MDDEGRILTDTTIDSSSTIGLEVFDLFSINDPSYQKSIEKTLEALWNTTPSGGMLRYQNDNYLLNKRQYSGNPWFICTLWYAQHLARTGQRDEARKIVEWVVERASPSGTLSEQIDPENSDFIGVSPLVWSHAELARTILDLQ